ncbi:MULTISPECIES: uroporphyrinogen-III synthase [unclassified Shewanella]|uniref:uroporphyrinogen-III synthase n=1 Tax=unclassified Shewanella TaxID=196818 RepID=UPI000C85D4B5|nr:MULTISPECIES: uroporphyrinogen-III synthase [unclassified Shewanella]MDO6620727.1 uroporphyrinogen-III synthase [Shewanella sp. 6_MG-2023]MDO6679367.1 uroporphyrinogen-III synthase [Shewanella sp. 4_MG-2023]MDO6775416.1 uroporphyrinogen-III synthase [Shewanella sp. 3_MG-2023]PMG30441.1 uroporphyrinogen III synthase [Shewanella sp. 10N.286.52.C2]PMG42682.1 uroporphyrinogen III synthase [Shewanella sp. 10N.286.52.B9]
MKVLLSRPEGRNQAMADKLKAKGVDFMVTPLLAVVPTHNRINPNTLTQADSLIFISTNAVKFAAISLNDKFPDCRYYAVGQATADALSQYNITPEIAPEDSQDSEGLLSLTSLSDIKNQHIVIVRGIGGRETIAEQLTLRQANVCYWEVYQRSLPKLDSALVCSQWQQFGIDTIIVTSGDVLENLIKLVPKELFAWLQSCHIIVPSNRVEQRAKIVGLTHVTNASGANTQAVLAALSV